MAVTDRLVHKKKVVTCMKPEALKVNLKWKRNLFTFYLFTMTCIHDSECSKKKKKKKKLMSYNYFKLWLVAAASEIKLWLAIVATSQAVAIC